MRRLTLITATVLLFVSGCTSDNDSGATDGASAAAPQTSEPTSEPTSAQETTQPACDDVWVAGKTLPDEYTTCLDGGEPATPDVIACIDGSSLVVHLDSFYAITGQEIVEPDVAPLQDTDEFGEAYATCTGE